VLTVGRRCSRGRLGEGVCAGGVDVHACSCPPQLRLLASGSSSPAGSRPPFLRRGAASSPSPSLPARADVKKRRKTQWGWWPGIRDSPAWRPFEVRPRAGRGDLPPVPLAVRRAGLVASVAAARATPRVCAVCVWGVIGSLYTPWPIPTQTRKHRPSACGPPGWRGRPVARPGVVRLG
jgi:hypothetical protein